MPGVRGGRRLTPMRDQVLHIAIDASLAEDQIHGQVSDGRRQTPFCGWLELIGQLDGMLGSAFPPVAATGDRRPRPKEQ